MNFVVEYAEIHYRDTLYDVQIYFLMQRTGSVMVRIARDRPRDSLI